MKEEKVDLDLLAAAQNGTITLNSQGAINLGTLLAPGTNETISIVIPLATQLATLRNSAIQPQFLCKQEPGSDNIVMGNVRADEKKLSPPKRKAPANKIKEDKTKGCPYPNCARYGRAFSRAHDLKRHIARHEARDDKPDQVNTDQLIYPCMICGAIFYNEQILQKHQLIHENGDMIPASLGPPYTCNFCNKTFESEDVLNSHLPVHIKAEPPALMFPPNGSAHPLARFSSSSIVPISSSVATTASSITPDDDFHIEDMLLIRKTPSTNKPMINNLAASTSSMAGGLASSKIRCEYCSKTFKTKWTLSSHVAAHEGRFQYQCCICSKRFVRKSHYESHVRCHDAARPYGCEHCGKTFKESKHRREHLKRKHPAGRNAIQSLLDSISACVTEETNTGTTATADPSKITIIMPMNFSS